jgi:hypothetical protein
LVKEIGDAVNALDEKLDEAGRGALMAAMFRHTQYM